MFNGLSYKELRNNIVPVPCSEKAGCNVCLFGGAGQFCDKMSCMVFDYKNRVGGEVFWLPKNSDVQNICAMDTDFLDRFVQTSAWRMHRMSRRLVLESKILNKSR